MLPPQAYGVTGICTCICILGLGGQAMMRSQCDQSSYREVKFEISSKCPWGGMGSWALLPLCGLLVLSFGLQQLLMHSLLITVTSMQEKSSKQH